MCCFAEEKSETKDTQLTLTYDKDKQQIPLNIVDLFHVLGLINYENSLFFFCRSTNGVCQLYKYQTYTGVSLSNAGIYLVP